MTVPYTITGSANHVSVLMTDKEYTEDGAAVKHYALLTGNAGGTGTFDLPSGYDQAGTSISLRRR